VRPECAAAAFPAASTAAAAEVMLSGRVSKAADVYGECSGPYTSASFTRHSQLSAIGTSKLVCAHKCTAAFGITP
jgi:hypothetical protein